MALNTIHVDISLWLGDLANFSLTRLVYIPVVMVVSSNYSAALAVWCKIAVQDPAAMLGVRSASGASCTARFSKLLWLTKAYGAILFPYVLIQPVATLLMPLGL